MTTTTTTTVSRANRAANDVAPFLNEYKQKFLFKRLIQTLFGGLILKIGDSDSRVPWFIYFFQIVFYLVPFLFGGACILVTDLTGLSRLYVSLVGGGLFMLYVLLLKLAVLVVSSRSYLAKLRKLNDFEKNQRAKMQKNHAVSMSKKLNKMANAYNDDEDYQFGKFFSMSTLNFLLPPIGQFITLKEGEPTSASVNKCRLFTLLLRIVFDAFLAGVLMFCAVCFESIVYLQSFYILAGAILVFIFNWIVLVNAFYSLCIHEPPEPAIYQAYDTFSIQHYLRTFYALCFFLIEMIYNFAPSNAQIPSTAIFVLKIVFIILPFLWFFGILAPIDAFVLWLLEQSFIFLYGGSATASNLRLIVQLLMSVIVSMAYFIPSDLAILLILAAFGYILPSFDLIYLIERLIAKVGAARKVYSSSGSSDLHNTSSTSDQLSTASTQALIRRETKPKKPAADSKPNPSSLTASDWLFNFVMLVLAVGVAALTFCLIYYLNTSRDTALQIETILLYVGIGLMVLCKILGDVQSVYWFFGLVRNPFFPRQCLTASLEFSSNGKKPKKPAPIRTVNHRRVFFTICKYLRIVLIRIVSPLLMCAIVSIDCSINKLYDHKELGYWRIVCALRAFRWIWQSTFICLFEMCFVTHLVMLVIWYNVVQDATTQAYLVQHFLTGCIVVSFARDRIDQCLRKCYTFLMITITAWTLKKQRRKTALVCMILNFTAFLPFVVLVVVLASLLSAPLLPLFTFPLYLIGFPRTKRFWPQKQDFFSKSITSLDSSERAKPDANQLKSYFSTPDSSFYAQMVPDLVASFRELMRSSSIGSLVEPDTFFLSRFQDRIIWMQVVETGHTYAILNIKGLELVETSCHTREAQKIDDLFDLAFENPDGAAANSKKCKKITTFNANAVSTCLRPCDVLVFDSYSDAKSSLIGILDTPDSYKAMAAFYPKIMHYFLIKYLLERRVSQAGASRKQPVDLNTFAAHSETVSNNKTSTVVVSELPSIADRKTPELSAKKRDKLAREASESSFEMKVKTPPVKERKASAEKPKKPKKQKQDDDWSDVSSIEEHSDSISSGNFSKSRKTKPSKSRDDDADSFTKPFEFDLDKILGVDESSPAPKKKTKKKAKAVKADDSDAEVDDELDLFANHIATIGKEKKGESKAPAGASLLELANKASKLQDDLEVKQEVKVASNKKKDTSLDSIEDSQHAFKIPSDWTRLLNENVATSSLSSNSQAAKEFKSSSMTREWLRKLIETAEAVAGRKYSTNLKPEDLNDYEVNQSAAHYLFVMKCVQSLNLSEGLIASNLNTVLVNKFYKGELPWSPTNEKISKEHRDLYEIVIKAFRYTIKTVIEHFTICPISDDSELLDNVKTFESEWFIGCDTEPDFAKNVISNKPFIFSLFKDPLKKELFARTLSLQRIKSPVARLNTEIVKAIWSATNMELLYMTNDDDERYSIQAHPNILRNLTIQSSDTPIGYCIYNSGNVYVPLMNPFK